MLASAAARFTGSSAAYTETVEASASADPTFTIDEPGYAAYHLTGLLVGPATAAREPGTWAMTFMGFAGIGFAGYRASRGTGMAHPAGGRPVRRR